MNEERTSIVYALKPKPRRGGASTAGNGYLAGVRSTDTYGTDDLLRDVAKATGQSEGLVRFVDTARLEAIVAALKAGKRVYLDGLAFAAGLEGPLMPRRSSKVDSCECCRKRVKYACCCGLSKNLWRNGKSVGKKVKSLV